MIFGEHNEHGYLGAPIAKHVIETYFAKKEGKPLPVLTPTGAAGAPRHARSRLAAGADRRRSGGRDGACSRRTARAALS